jgi:hypothetical protein
MISIETATKLKDSGFPQKPEDMLAEVEYCGDKYQRPTIPTLSELIEACGGSLESLNNHQNGWMALGRIGDITIPNAFIGKTPEEAVSKLWLCVNKKDA